MRKKMIPLSKGAELAGKINRDGTGNRRALKQWIRRYNRANPRTPILSSYGVVDEITLLAAVDVRVERETPGMPVTRAVDRTRRVHTSEGRVLQ